MGHAVLKCNATWFVILTQSRLMPTISMPIMEHNHLNQRHISKWWRSCHQLINFLVHTTGTCKKYSITFPFYWPVYQTDWFQWGKKHWLVGKPYLQYQSINSVNRTTENIRKITQTEYLTGSSEPSETVLAGFFVKTLMIKWFWICFKWFQVSTLTLNLWERKQTGINKFLTKLPFRRAHCLHHPDGKSGL